MKHFYPTFVAVALCAIGCSNSSNESGQSGESLVSTQCATADGDGYGDGSGSCGECEDTYQEIFNDEFGDGAGDGDGSGSGEEPGAGEGSGYPGDGSGSGMHRVSSAATTSVNPQSLDPLERLFTVVDGEMTDEIFRKCAKVSKVVYTETFNCRDYTGWFLRCMRDAGVPGEGFDMWCKNCDNPAYENGRIGHRIVMYKKDGKWCPADPKWGGGEEASSCCNTSKAAAQNCAHTRYCGGTWVNRSTPSDRKAGCEKDTSRDRTCEYCMRETCTDEERERVCEILDIDPDPAEECGEKRTNSQCTQCCIDAFPAGSSRSECQSQCVNKPHR